MTIEKTPLTDLEQAASVATVELLHSEELEKFEFSDGDSSIDVYIGAPADDGHVVVSTFGAGGLPTKGTVNFDGENVPYRAEFFGIANSREEGLKLADKLARIVFTVAATEEAFFPGLIVQGFAPAEAELSHVFLATSPVGSNVNHGHEPLLTDEFALFWVAVNSLTEAEAKVVMEGDDGLTKISDLATEQGAKFYYSERKSLV